MNCGAKSWKQQRSCRGTLHDDDDDDKQCDSQVLPIDVKQANNRSNVAMVRQYNTVAYGRACLATAGPLLMFSSKRGRRRQQSTHWRCCSVALLRIDVINVFFTFFIQVTFFNILTFFFIFFHVFLF